MNKILIIDDDEGTARGTANVAYRSEAEAIFAGLRKKRHEIKEKLSAALLDVMMPGMDGFETLEEIRKENSLPVR